MMHSHIKQKNCIQICDAFRRNVKQNCIQLYDAFTQIAKKNCIQNYDSFTRNAKKIVNKVMMHLHITQKNV